MNYVNTDVKFTTETERDFDKECLPALSFEILSTLEGVRHSYFEKSMRSQILTQKFSRQSEQSKSAFKKKMEPPTFKEHVCKWTLQQ